MKFYWLLFQDQKQITRDAHVFVQDLRAQRRCTHEVDDRRSENAASGGDQVASASTLDTQTRKKRARPSMCKHKSDPKSGHAGEELVDPSNDKDGIRMEDVSPLDLSETRVLQGIPEQENRNVSPINSSSIIQDRNLNQDDTMQHEVHEDRVSHDAEVPPVSQEITNRVTKSRKRKAGRSPSPRNFASESSGRILDAHSPSPPSSLSSITSSDDAETPLTFSSNPTQSLSSSSTADPMYDDQEALLNTSISLSQVPPRRAAAKPERLSEIMRRENAHRKDLKRYLQAKSKPKPTKGKKQTREDGPKTVEPVTATNERQNVEVSSISSQQNDNVQATSRSTGKTVRSSTQALRLRAKHLTKARAKKPKQANFNTLPPAKRLRGDISLVGSLSSIMMLQAAQPFNVTTVILAPDSSTNTVQPPDVAPERSPSEETFDSVVRKKRTLEQARADSTGNVNPSSGSPNETTRELSSKPRRGRPRSAQPQPIRSSLSGHGPACTLEETDQIIRHAATEAIQELNAERPDCQDDFQGDAVDLNQDPSYELSDDSDDEDVPEPPKTRSLPSSRVARSKMDEVPSPSRPPLTMTPLIWAEVSVSQEMENLVS